MQAGLDFGWIRSILSTRRSGIIWSQVFIRNWIDDTRISKMAVWYGNMADVIV